MSASKIKNIVIIVLLLFNAILLAVFAFDRAEASRSKAAEIAALTEVMGEWGIDIADDIDFDVAAPVPCTVLRDMDADDRLIGKVIDHSYREDLGGNVFFYSSETGQAVLRGTGEIDLIFHEDFPDISDDTARSLAKYMKRCGVELSAEHAEFPKDKNGGSVLIPCSYNGSCVYNSKLSFTVSDGSLMMINGTRVFAGEAKVRQEELIDSVSAVMLFLEYVRSDGYICSRINGLESGYFMNVAVSGESSLRPVWRISTDTGVVYINAVSGKAETMPA